MNMEKSNQSFSEIERKRALESALLCLMDEEPFYGSLLQELTIRYSDIIPTAAISFDKKCEQFAIYLNPSFFCTHSTLERAAVLEHEILHFTNKHLFRLPFMDAKEEDRNLYNIAGDMAINQYIDNLPKGCIDVKDWRMKNGNNIVPFPLLRSMETYYELIKDNQDVNKEKMSSQPLDVHAWEKLDEETKKAMLDEAKKLVKRAKEKLVNSHSSIPKGIEEFLEELDVMSNEINHKQLLRDAIKRTVSCADKEHTWKRPNRRYGIAAPGNKLGELPRLNFYVDTSGSISIREANEFFGIMGDFLKVGVRNCSLGLWHTQLYHKERFKIHQEIKREVFQNGGTSIQCVVEDIAKNKPDLSIVLTDMYFEMPNNLPEGCEIIWIVSKGGNKHCDAIKNKSRQKIIFLDNLI